MKEHLRVWLGSAPVGVLERDEHDMVRFVPDGDVSGLSVTARGSDAWGPELTSAWFGGLLPEGARRERIEGRLGLREGDTFGLLREIGWECAGAVSVLPPDRNPAGGRIRPASDHDVAARLDALPDLGPGRLGELRMSLGGAQDKLLLAGHPGGWALPEDGAPSTWILKPEPDRWPGLAAAEAWALGLASTVTEACEAHVESSLGRRPVLAVKRYDRSEREGQTVRIHQEDLCQALGLPASRKYARPGGPPALSPALAGLARILRERAVSPDEELMRLLQQVVVSVALRNTDLHGKNLSLVHVQGVVALAPAYDITTTTAFIPAQQHIGLSIGGTFRIDQIAGDHLVREARSWGMPERIATEVVRSTAAVLRAATAGVMHEIPGLPESVKAIADVGIEAVSVPRPGTAPSRQRATELGRATRTTSTDGAEPPA